MTETPKHRRLPRGRAAALAGALGLLALGGGAGALAVKATRPAAVMAPATPIAVRALTDDSLATIRGRVAEVYGNKFILADASGRALVETGPAGDDGALVAVGQTVTVQGRFDDGFMRAGFLVGADGKVTSLGPLHGPRHGPGHRGPHGPGRPDRDGGPDGDDRRDAPPPPPAAAPAATAPATGA